MEKYWWSQYLSCTRKHFLTRKGPEIRAFFKLKFMILEVDCVFCNQSIIDEQIEKFGNSIDQFQEWIAPISFLVESIDEMQGERNNPNRTIVTLQSGSVFMVNLPYVTLRDIWSQFDSVMSLTTESLNKKQAVEK